MAGVTDPPFRQLYRQQDAEFTISEMISSEPQLPTSSAKTRKRLEHQGDVEPRVAQIASSDMIGRAGRGRPWLFREINHYLKTGNVPQEPTISEVRDIMLKNLENLYSFYGDYSGIRVARKHIIWYTLGYPGHASFRQRIIGIENTKQQSCMTHKFIQEQIKA